MKKIYLILYLAILSITVFCQTYDGTIIRVIDGDTYVFQTAEGSFIVRMQGIDAPEKDQPFSNESSEFLQQYLNKDAVTVAKGHDRYSRTLGTLIIDSQDINLLSIKGGFSWHYKKYSSDKEYASVEEFAKQNKLGLWKAENPIPPWEWRQK